jgi:hypothetical protein
LIDGNQREQFDIPSTEWLEEFTNTINGPVRSINMQLIESGFSYVATAAESFISIQVFFKNRQVLSSLDLSRIEAALLHTAILGSIVGPFIAQGGKLGSLLDLQSFLLVDWDNVGSH